MFFNPRGRMPYNTGRRNHGGGGNMGVMLLIANVMRIGLEHIPPVTLGIIGLCTLLYLQVIPMASHLNSSNTCFNFMDLVVMSTAASTASGWRGSALWRLMEFVASPIVNFVSFSPQQHPVSLHFTPKLLKNLALSNFFHANDFHLYYNMMSWLYKGRTYELVYGSEFFALWLLCAVAGTSAMYVLLCSVITFIIKDPSSYIGYTFGSWLEPNACVVGFSGVIFCLKTVLNYYNVQAHGEIDEAVFIPFFGAIFNTPLRHAVWAELLIIQLFTPQVSFLAHLAGILAGLLFVAIDLVGVLRPLGDVLKELRRGLCAPVVGGNNNNHNANRQGGYPEMPRGHGGGFDAR